jgi:predicted ABC-type ATPase
MRRMRVFAGPNGSGETTILKVILEQNKFSFRQTPNMPSVIE